MGRQPARNDVEPPGPETAHLEQARMTQGMHLLWREVWTLKELAQGVALLAGRQAARFSCGPPPPVRLTSTAIAVTANTQEPAPPCPAPPQPLGGAQAGPAWPSRRSGGFPARTLTVAGAYLRNSTPELPSVAGTGLAASKAASTVAIWQVMGNSSGSCRDAWSVRQAAVQINDGIRIWIYACPDCAPLSRPSTRHLRAPAPTQICLSKINRSLRSAGARTCAASGAVIQAPHLTTRREHARFTPQPVARHVTPSGHRHGPDPGPTGAGPVRPGRQDCRQDGRHGRHRPRRPGFHRRIRPPGGPADPGRLGQIADQRRNH